eukprot:TRINITY_DN6022_c0_g2_i5.p1 TRINITY_DN6022_c0_g2~~TRINITY_DN6022_c0_g2_i5.p1  ORF type:complete len:481 (+),score=104.28 TRINITY_DN6022_c0_g2_i5:96-1538(+)
MRVRWALLLRAVGALAVAWVLLSSYVWWQMLIIKEMASDLQREGTGSSEMVVVALYTFLGGLGWNFVMWLATLLLAGFVFYTGLSGCIDACDAVEAFEVEDTFKVIRWILCAFLFVAYFLICAVSFQAPIGDYRRTKQNLKALDAGGVALVACYKEDAHALTIPEDAVWVFLEGSGWTVNMSAIVYKTHPEAAAWKYGLAPIIYKGPSYDYSLFGAANDTAFLKSNDTDFECRFDPPIYATCVTNGAFQPAKCNAPYGEFNTSERGYTLSIRKTRWGDFFDTTERRLFPQRGFHRMFDFDSYSIFEVKDQVDSAASDEYHMRRRTMIIWLGISAGLLCLFLFRIRGNVYDPSSSSVQPSQAPSDDEMRAYGDGGAGTPTHHASDTPIEGGTHKWEDLIGATYQNATIEECEVVDCTLLNCVVNKVDFKGVACHLEQCTVRQVSVYCKVTVTGGTFDSSAVKRGGELHNLGGCAVNDVDGY